MTCWQLDNNTMTHEFGGPADHRQYDNKGRKQKDMTSHQHRHSHADNNENNKCWNDVWASI